MEFHGINRERNLQNDKNATEVMAQLRRFFSRTIQLAWSNAVVTLSKASWCPKVEAWKKLASAPWRPDTSINSNLDFYFNPSATSRILLSFSLLFFSLFIVSCTNPILKCSSRCIKAKVTIF